MACYKRRFPDEQAADLALLLIHVRKEGPVPKPVRSYKCQGCAGWHLTRQGPASYKLAGV